MELFRDKFLVTKEYFEKKPVTPESETLTQQLNLAPLDKNTEEKEETPIPPGRVLGHEALQGKLVGLYFSASWCPPCQMFIPQLCDMYNELLKRKANFEIVFLSFDKNETEMEMYFRSKQGNWHALPFDDPFKEELKVKYNVTAIPRFIVIHPDGEVITAKGRKEVQDKGIIAFRNWQQTANIYESKQALTTLADSNNIDQPNGTSNEHGAAT